MSITLADQIACVERLIGHVCRLRDDYIRSDTEKEAFSMEIETLQAVLETLQKLDGVESLFPEEDRDDWYREDEIPGAARCSCKLCYCLNDTVDGGVCDLCMYGGHQG